LFKSNLLTEEQNTLILFKRKESIDIMKEFIETHYPQYKIYIIKGEVAAKTRDRYRMEVNAGPKNIILATFGTMKQGVNIKFLHNLVFAEFSKSMYEVVQSIGRIVRLHKDKKLARVFDIVDDASYVTRSRGGGDGTPKENYAMKHYNERLGFYVDDQFPVIEHVLPFTVSVDPDDLDRKKKEAAKKAASKKANKSPDIKGKGKGSQFMN
jgi:type I site-specific restriction endonuclease